MRAYLHDAQEPHELHARAGYIGARPNYSILTDFSCNVPPVHTFGSLSAADSLLTDLSQRFVFTSESRPYSPSVVSRVPQMRPSRNNGHPVKSSNEEYRRAIRIMPAAGRAVLASRRGWRRGL